MPNRRIRPSRLIALVLLWLSTTAVASTDELLLDIHSPGLARLVTVPVQLEGRDYLFMLDTGASHHVLDLSFRPLLGQRLGQTRLRSGEMVEAYGGVSMQLGKAEIPDDWPVNTMNLEPVRQISGQPVYGILGMRFLRDYVWELDFPRERIRMFRRLPYRLQGWYPIPMRFNGRHQPLVQARAGALGLAVMVDTGFNGQVALAPRAFNRLIGQGAIDLNASSMAVTVIGMVNNPGGRLASFDLGGLRYPGVNVHQAHLDLLGLGVLGRQAVVLDFPGARLWLAPPPMSSPRFSR